MSFSNRNHNLIVVLPTILRRFILTYYTLIWECNYIYHKSKLTNDLKTLIASPLPCSLLNLSEVIQFYIIYLYTTKQNYGEKPFYTRASWYRLKMVHIDEYACPKFSFHHTLIESEKNLIFVKNLRYQAFHEILCQSSRLSKWRRIKYISKL